MIHDPHNVFISDDFGSEVILHLPTGNKPITAIFDNGYYDSQIGEVILDTTKKVLTVSMSKIIGLAREHEVTRDCTRYRVINIEPDGTGIGYVNLSEADT